MLILYRRNLRKTSCREECGNEDEKRRGEAVTNDHISIQTFGQNWTDDSGWLGPLFYIKCDGGSGSNDNFGATSFPLPSIGPNSIFFPILNLKWQAVWPDWAIFCTLGNFLKPLATINLPKSPTFLGNFCKGVKIYHFTSEIIFGQLL